MDKDFRIYSELMPAYFPTAAPPLPPPKSRKEKGKVGEGAKKPASGGSSEEEEEMDQSGIPLRRDGSAAGDEESATGEKESLPGGEESSNQNLDQPTGEPRTLKYEKQLQPCLSMYTAVSIVIHCSVNY